MSAHWSMLFAVGVGSALGGIARYLTRVWIPDAINEAFPMATLVVNVVGCFIAGFLLVYWQHTFTSPLLKAAIMIGFLGALTTFSSFSVETLHLALAQDWVKMLLNIGLNLGLSLIAVFLGAVVGGRIVQL